MDRKVQMYTGWRTLNNNVYYFQKEMPMEISVKCIRLEDNRK